MRLISQTYVLGPDNWVENRNEDGIVESLTVRVHGWHAGYLPPTKLAYHSGETVFDFSAESKYKSDSFTVNIPEEFQTSATFHHHSHDNMSAENNEAWQITKNWFPLIKEHPNYLSAIEQVKQLMENDL